MISVLQNAEFPGTATGRIICFAEYRKYGDTRKFHFGKRKLSPLEFMVFENAENMVCSLPLAENMVLSEYCVKCRFKRLICCQGLKYRGNTCKRCKGHF